MKILPDGSKSKYKNNVSTYEKKFLCKNDIILMTMRKYITGDVNEEDIEFGFGLLFGACLFYR